MVLLFFPPTPMKPLQYVCLEKEATEFQAIPQSSKSLPIRVNFENFEKKRKRCFSAIKVYFNISVTVYRCEMLGEDCTMCNALKTDIYECNWCMQNHCGPKLTCQKRDICPLPNITEVSNLTF